MACEPSCRSPVCFLCYRFVSSVFGKNFMSTVLIDTFKFCHHQESLAGECLVSDLGRLSAECADHSGSMNWSLSGMVDQREYCRMTVAVSGTVHLMCQRCLTPFDFLASSETTLVLVKNEAQADEVETWLDDSVDVVVGSQEFNVMQLVEDEFLLSLPFSPKHETCLDSKFDQEDVKKQNLSPFRVLKNTKK